jgi:transcriptional regulator with XRE-family HTH domain
MSWEDEWNATVSPRSAQTEVGSAPTTDTTVGASPRSKPARRNGESLTFGPLLAEFRQQRNFSQARLCERSDVDHSYVSRLESGSRMPSWDAVQRFAAALDLSADDHNRLLAAAGFLPDDLTGIIDPLAVEVQRVLLAVKGTEREQELRQAVAFMLKAAA